MCDTVFCDNANNECAGTAPRTHTAGQTMKAHFLPALFLFCIAAPSLAQQPDLAEGKRIFDQMCAGCHGFRGDGGEGHRGGFSPHIGTLANKEYMASVPDDYLFLIIKKGGAYMGKMATMPAWEKRLSDEQVRSIVAHIRTF
jgi:mono/diheme cytochrome c family protein